MGNLGPLTPKIGYQLVIVVFSVKKTAITFNSQNIFSFLKNPSMKLSIGLTFFSSGVNWSLKVVGRPGPTL